MQIIITHRSPLNNLKTNDLTLENDHIKVEQLLLALWEQPETNRPAGLFVSNKVAPNTLSSEMLKKQAEEAKIALQDIRKLLAKPNSTNNLEIKKINNRRIGVTLKGNTVEINESSYLKYRNQNQKNNLIETLIATLARQASLSRSPNNSSRHSSRHSSKNNPAAQIEPVPSNAAASTPDLQKTDALYSLLSTPDPLRPEAETNPVFPTQSTSQAVQTRQQPNLFSLLKHPLFQAALVGIAIGIGFSLGTLGTGLESLTKLGYTLAASLATFFVAKIIQSPKPPFGTSAVDNINLASSSIDPKLNQSIEDTGSRAGVFYSRSRSLQQDSQDSKTPIETPIPSTTQKNSRSQKK